VGLFDEIEIGVDFFRLITKKIDNNKNYQNQNYDINFFHKEELFSFFFIFAATFTIWFACAAIMTFFRFAFAASFVV
jgi:hypothetical protein